ncbi:MAG: hypothetical protein P1U65_02950 [Minwuia sp.]|nr:hypothetical protein [Minwuia sp.]
MSPLRTADAISALGLGLRRGGSLDLSSGTGGIITNLGGVADPDVIEILFAGVSVSGSDHLLVRLGDSAGVETESYQSASGASSASGTFASSSTGLVIYQGGSGHWNGCMQLRRVTGNLWISSHAIQISATGGIAAGGGQKAVTATLDRIAIAVSGANTFDGGSVQVLAGKAG